MDPTSLLFFGPTGGGKSSVGEALADMMGACAHIEVDTLRYMVRSGLVAWSRGASPAAEPEEYARQCDLGYRNAVALCREFSAAGFSTVVEGLGDGCLPGTGWIEREFHEARVLSVALYCQRDELQRRLEQRQGWPRELMQDAEKELSWCLDNLARFDRALDTTGLDPQGAARRLLASLAA